jgi:predicted PurR-regulated permease PerM
MARMVSFFVLVAIMLAIGVLFFEVMIGFLLPLFLAVLMVVMFRPVHHWIRDRFGKHERLAAGATTGLILLIFLIPLLIILFEAGIEGYAVYKEIGVDDFQSFNFHDLVNRFNEFTGYELTAKEVQTELAQKVQSWLAPLLLGTTQYTVRMFLGLFIMVISLYYFFADGQSMSSSLTDLSPLETNYTQDLVREFDNISRAVVLASIAAALAQGLLTGAALFFLGIEAVFLLTFITMLFAMIPFVGATGVWLPCSLWLYFHDDRMAAAVGLAIYGMVVVGTVDNLLKPWILQGRSNLHPLMALLSVLGGVQVLGPIGIFVGPMLVTFLHALLIMFRKELTRFGEEGIDFGGTNASQKPPLAKEGSEA